MFGWSEFLVLTAVGIVALKWRSLPSVALQIRSSWKNLREGLRGDPPPRIRDVKPLDKEKK